MSNILFNWLVRIFGLGWLTGPIFDKELRVSSRRRRNYVLRSVYVGLFMLILIMVWTNFVAYRARPSAVYVSSRMAEAGLMIISFVIWFQFMASQAIAIVMLSTSISDEIYHRTLGVLMTTPIGSLQIVLGKLLSKLLQLMLLLAITLPLLAIVRIFGGVPWGHLVASLCVTLTTLAFVGSLSLFFSIFTRRAYVVIMVTILTMGLLFALIPYVVAFLLYYPNDPGTTFVKVLSCVNPYLIMGMETTGLFAPRPRLFVAWPIHCAAMLGVSGLLLLVSVVFVRKAALRQAMGQTGLWSDRRRAGKKEETAQTGATRRVTGSAVLWKERQIPLLGRRKVAKILAGLAVVALLLLTYELCARKKALEEQETHAAYIVIFASIGMLFTTVLPATCITVERESRTWPLLLTTTTGDWEIIGGKLLGTLRRCLPAWLLLFIHTIVFVLAGMIHPVSVLQLGILVAWIMLFLSGTGLYFSTRFKHTTTAVIANMALAVGLWAILPLVLGIARTDDLLKLCVDMNPLVHAGVIASATSHRGGLAAYEWLEGGMSDVVEATGWIVLTFVVYVTVGLVFVARASSRLRIDPF